MTPLPSTRLTAKFSPHLPLTRSAMISISMASLASSSSCSFQFFSTSRESGRNKSAQLSNKRKRGGTASSKKRRRISPSSSSTVITITRAEAAVKGEARLLVESQGFRTFPVSFRGQRMAEWLECLPCVSQVWGSDPEELVLRLGDWDPFEPSCLVPPVYTRIVRPGDDMWMTTER